MQYRQTKLPSPILYASCRRPIAVSFALVSLSFFSSVDIAGQTATGDGSFSLFNPAPRSQWRELSADRPDFTESPFTVDPGAFQLEMSVIDYSRDNGTKTFSVLPVNFKLGLTSDIDLQLVYEPYVRVENDISGNVDGTGDAQVRIKVGLWGNDNRTIGIGVMPYLKVPLASGDIGNGQAEGGIIVPFATGLSDNFGLGLMFQTDLVYSEIADKYDTELIISGALGYSVNNTIGLYGESVGIYTPAGDLGNRGLVNFGVTLSANDNLVLDLGLSTGLTDDSDEINLFSGLTHRFGPSLF